MLAESRYCEIYYFLNRGKDSQGEEVIKPYTPTTLDSDVGHFELVIKVCIFRASFWRIEMIEFTFLFFLIY